MNSKNSERGDNGRFIQNNPGKPKGALNKTTKAAVALLQGQAESLTQKAIEMALDGDLVALKLCLERIIPPRKERPLELDCNKANLKEIRADVIQAIVSGDITPSEGETVCRVINSSIMIEEKTSCDRIDFFKNIYDLVE
jgi:hypothetical protein